MATSPRTSSTLLCPRKAWRLQQRGDEPAACQQLRFLPQRGNRRPRLRLLEATGRLSISGWRAPERAAKVAVPTPMFCGMNPALCMHGVCRNSRRTVIIDSGLFLGIMVGDWQLVLVRMWPMKVCVRSIAPHAAPPCGASRHVSRFFHGYRRLIKYNRDIRPLFARYVLPVTDLIHPKRTCG